MPSLPQSQRANVLNIFATLLSSHLKGIPLAQTAPPCQSSCLAIAVWSSRAMKTSCMGSIWVGRIGSMWIGRSCQ